VQAKAVTVRLRREAPREDPGCDLLADPTAVVGDLDDDRVDTFGDGTGADAGVLRRAGRRIARIVEQVHEDLQRAMAIGCDFQARIGRSARMHPAPRTRRAGQARRIGEEVGDAAGLDAADARRDLLLTTDDDLDVLDLRLQPRDLLGRRIGMRGAGRRERLEESVDLGPLRREELRRLGGMRLDEPPQEADVFTPFSALPTSWSTLVAFSAIPASRESRPNSCECSSSRAALICASQ
jgi:hypothetical protein